MSVSRLIFNNLRGAPGGTQARRCAEGGAAGLEASRAAAGAMCLEVRRRGLEPEASSRGAAGRRPAGPPHARCARVVRPVGLEPTTNGLKALSVYARG